VAGKERKWVCVGCAEWGEGGLNTLRERELGLLLGLIYGCATGFR